VPTKSELQSLIDAGSVWTRRNRVNGRLFGTAPNQIFLPAVFECNIDIPVLVGAPQPTVNRNIACGNYWSSEASDTGLWFLNFDKNYAHIGEWGYYQNSRGVRCVTE
jgi:hypothetical protein